MCVIVQLDAGLPAACADQNYVMAFDFIFEEEPPEDFAFLAMCETPSFDEWYDDPSTCRGPGPQPID